MAERLSDTQLTAVLDGGCRALPWSVPAPTGFLAGVDLDRILAEPDAKKIIRALPIQPLLAAIQARGLSESLEVIDKISQEQFTRLLDYDVWVKDELVAGRFWAWLMAYNALGPEKLCKRFIDLEEEYQLTLLVGKINVIDQETYENLPPELQDQYFAMPCNTVYYRILCSHDSEIQAVQNLIEAIVSHNIKYAYALINHASYMPPEESSALERQFRKARLEEDGFVSYEESLTIFVPLDLAPYEAKWFKFKRGQGHAADLFPALAGGANFFDVLLTHVQFKGWSVDDQYRVHQGLLYVANSLTSASGVESSDTDGLNRILEQLKALTGLALDYLSQGDLDLAVEILAAEPPKILFRTGLSLVDRVRHQALEVLAKLKLPKFDEFVRLFQKGRQGAALLMLDREYQAILGQEIIEILRGLFNRYPMCALLHIEEKRERIQFAPLGSMILYQELVGSVAGIAAVSSLAGAPDGISFDEQVSRYLVGSLLKKQDNAPLNDQDIAEFMALPQDELALRSEALNEQIKSDLLKSDLWATRAAWQINVAAHLISDLFLGVLRARKSSEAALRSLIGRKSYV